MTLEEIKRSDKLFLIAADIAPVLGCDPNLIRWEAQHEPGRLGFPVTVLKSRVKIPRIPFIEYVEGKSKRPDTAATVSSQLSSKG